MGKIVLITAFVSVIIIACNNNTTQKIDSNEDTLEVISKEEQIFQVPSPDEFINLLKEAKAEFVSNITVPENYNYVDPLKQKIILGVYVSDMAYLATYNKFQETVRYFAKVKQISEQIGILQVIDKSTFDRLEQNVTNVDSITSITNNSFYNIVDKIQQNDDGKTLALISYGGWIESMYIATELAGNFSQQNQVIQQIASQKIVLNNLIKMFESLKDKSNVDEIISNLKKLLEAMNDIKAEVVEVQTKADTSKVIIGGKTKYFIDKSTYQNIRNIIKSIREEIIKPA